MTDLFFLFDILIFFFFFFFNILLPFNAFYIYIYTYIYEIIIRYMNCLSGDIALVYEKRKDKRKEKRRENDG